MIEDQHDDCSDHGDQQAVQIQACNTGGSEEAKHKAADDCANDAQDDIHEDSLAMLVDDLAGKESGNESENDPG